MAADWRMSPTRHAALCTCAPSTMVGGAFCRHPSWSAVGALAPGGEPARILYQCGRCGVTVAALPETSG